MPYNNLHIFKNKRILLLQGPVGPFFYRFAQDLRQISSTVYKINFNGGDQFFYPEGIPFRGSLSDLKAFLTDFIKQHQIDIFIMFGDCRPIHLEAKEVAQQEQVEVYVFEEGYLRPNHITLESQGVNGYSPLSKDAKDYLLSHLEKDIDPAPITEVGKTFWYATLWAIIYYVSASILGFKYPKYQHHRTLSISEAYPWVRGTVRKWFYKFKEYGIESKLTQELSDQYFLVPLQVHNDFQLTQHSDYDSNQDFISTIISSFAKNAPSDTYLVLKQHPFDRGYQDYSKQIVELSKQFGIEKRVFYIHDQYLPLMIEHARGVVVINSTVGLSAVSQFKPVKVCGQAIYDIPYITAQTSLDDFWKEAQNNNPDPSHVHQYLYYLSKHTQHNGSFYRKLPHSNHYSGINWTDIDR